jgi:hypothetical protein
MAEREPVAMSARRSTDRAYPLLSAGNVVRVFAREQLAEDLRGQEVVDLAASDTGEPSSRSTMPSSVGPFF